MTDDPKPAPPTPDAKNEQDAKPAPDAPEEQEAPAPQKTHNRGRSRWGFRLLILLLLVALLLLLLWWKHCLPGQGGGGERSAKESGPAAMTSGEGMAARGAACDLRVDAKGIAVAGRPVANAKAALEACGDTKRAVLTVTGDARFGTVRALEKDLRAAGITVQRQR